MSAGQLAALIAALSAAVLAGAAVAVLCKLARLTAALERLVTDRSGRSDQLLERAEAAVSRTGEQLTRTESITASMDQVTANMAELSGRVSALTGVARMLADAVGAPLTGLSALAYGVRRAMLARRAGSATPIRGGAGDAVALAPEAPPQAALTGSTGTTARRSGGTGGDW